MKKKIFLMLLIIGSLTFSADTKKEIYNLITDIEAAPENPKNSEKLQKIVRFTIEDEDTTVYLICNILGNKEKDRVDDKSQNAIIMSYTMGALKEQLISEKKLTQDETTLKGIFAALKTYNRLKKTNDIYIEYFELLNEFDFSKLLSD